MSLNGPRLGKPREIAIEAFGERFLFTARSFFQGNRVLIDKLVETAIGDARGGLALDLYCGVGLFTLPLARRFEKLVGVEENSEAVDFAINNAANAGLANAEFRAAQVRSFLANTIESNLDLALLDPPRFGTEKETIMNLIRLSPKRVSYVACEPSVLARDLRRFDDSGYAIESITAIDLFPQTHHIETVVHLGLKS
ncbi:MAG TPA: methyltransferase [Candidatus Limnocylindria bacterium]|nr:methyltransferase [Candidatus Limnocylindria bacterium]